MDDHPIRCQHIEKGAEVRSTYSIVALDYYDGPTSGVMLCHICSAEYKFMMLDWDDNQGNRVYSLEPLAPHSFQLIVDLLSKYEQPKLPLWFPLRQYSSKRDYDLVEQRIAEIIGQAGLATAVIAMSQWGEAVLAARALSTADTKYVQSWFALAEPKASHNWFSFLGLDRTLSEERSHP